MTTAAINRRWWIAAGLVVLGVLPILMFFVVFGRAPTVTAPEARRLLVEADAVLVDVRTPESFANRHIVGSINWPFAAVRQVNATDQVPPALRGRTVLLICNVGLESARAALQLAPLFSSDVYNVKGGLQDWGRDLRAGAAAPYSSLFLTGRGAGPFPRRNMPLGLQWAASLAAFGVKPLYMTLALVLIVVLWRQEAGDLRALKWGLIAFLAGEGMCALNYTLFRETSYLVEYLHSLGMAAALGCMTYAVLAGFEQRILGIGHPKKKCAGLAICPACIAYEDTACGAMRLMMLLALFLSVCAWMPWLSTPQAVSYSTRILDSDYFYTHPVIYQYFEIRYAPAAALILYLVAVPLLGGRRPDRFAYGRISFAAATGLLGFAFLRLVLLSIYRDNLAWFVIWEEVTELLFVATVAGVLYLFQARLLRRPA